MAHSSPCRSGFTLLELLIAIVIVSAVGVVVLAPALVSVRGFGRGGAAAMDRTALVCRGQAALFERELAGTGADRWASTMTSFSAASPFPVTPSPQVDGETFDVTRSVTCVAQDLITTDPACASDYVRVAVAVNDSGETACSLTFIATRKGL